MFIGPLEIVLVVLVSIGALVVSRWSKRRTPWIVAACFGLAMVVTPPDPASMLVVAVPFSALFMICATREWGELSS